MTEIQSGTPGLRQLLFRKLLILGLILLITILHYTIDTSLGPIHDVLLRSYYLPIILAGLWFGTRGGLLSALAVTLVFMPHALHGWDAPYTGVFRLIEILMYYVIGGITGSMASRAQRALQAERMAGEEREKAHEALRLKTTELFETEEELRRSERLAALGRMSGGLAHEIRNPLASIKTSAELLEERCAGAAGSSSDEDSIDLLGVIIEESARLNRILTEFLQFARAEIRQDSGAPKECLLGEVLEGTLFLLQQELDDGGVEVLFEESRLQFQLSMGEDPLRQVFLNLLLNARDALPEGGKVRITLLESTPNYLRLVFEDSGPGIPPDVARRIFDPFFSTKDEGVGLGLSIVARLLEASGGSIRLGPDAETGACFQLSLPRLPS